MDPKTIGVLTGLMTLVIALNGVAYANPETHVCTENVLQSVQGTKTNTARDRYTRRCGWFNWFRCSSYRNTYTLAYQKTYRMNPVHSCCEGWKNLVNGVCSTPICSPCCENGGTCVSPNVCDCPPGFSGPRCSESTNYCASNNCEQNCVNAPGRAVCYCDQGYYLTQGGESCADINECVDSNGGCAHTCHNTFGSFLCSCNPGFTLGSDGRSCN
ncbi:multiple epidermal growth factor-like domains protein 6 [Ptychodera flava]|uniref:multiple epidermal growth factor-like domains protein 6 n=1 Tax=Ptychodera flava TaxID=63121 RepID=UPI00396A3C2C